MAGFEVVWEVESPQSADTDGLERQLDTARQVATSVLVPDNHTGRAMASSIVVAARSPMPATACINARDRNLLGLRRDLITCELLGVDRLLLVYGDDPSVGARAGDLTVRSMLAECRASAARFDVAVTTRLGPLPAWKRDADRLFVQIGFDVERLLRWRDTIDFDGPVLAGVLVVGSPEMAGRLAAHSPELRVPAALVDALRTDRDAGVVRAVELVQGIRASGAFAGVHLIGGGRHRSLAEALLAAGAVDGTPAGAQRPTAGCVSAP